MPFLKRLHFPKRIYYPAFPKVYIILLAPKAYVLV